MSNAMHAPKGISLAPYVALTLTYLTVFGSALVAASRRGLPRRIPAADLVLLGIATHALTRIVTRDVVTAPFRAPFTEFEQRSGAGEQSERARGTGFRHAIGELVTCPYCAAPWIASSLFVALMLRPRATRLAASAFSVVAISNFLNQAYSATRKLA